MVIMTLKDCINGVATFQFYRSGELHYKCANGFMFRIPVAETHDAVFNNEDKGIVFMRWIRKELNAIETARLEQV